MEGTVASDSGAQIRDGIKSVNTQGDCPESLWPYDPSQFAAQPPQSCYDAALKDRAVQYQSVDQNLADMQGCLASGYPFVFGFTVHQSSSRPRSPRPAMVPMPDWFDPPVGGHAVLAVGYDNGTQLSRSGTRGGLAGATAGTSTCRMRTCSTTTCLAISGPSVSSERNEAERS